jgi:hypothetical protein
MLLQFLSKYAFFIIPVKIPKRPSILMSHSSPILVLIFSIVLRTLVFLPFIGHSSISTLIDFLTSNCAISLKKVDKEIFFVRLIT